MSNSKITKSQLNLLWYSHGFKVAEKILCKLLKLDTIPVTMHDLKLWEIGMVSSDKTDLLLFLIEEAVGVEPISHSQFLSNNTTVYTFVTYIDSVLAYRNALTSLHKITSSKINLGSNDNSYISVLGMSCTFPDHKEDYAGFRDLIKIGYVCGKEATGSRILGNSKFEITAGFIDNIDCFDNEFFHISPKEARLMDPKQRLILQTAYHATQNSNLCLVNYKEQKTGVFIGTWSNDYASLISHDLTEQSAMMIASQSEAIIAGRIAYFFDVTGISLSLNTTFSSSCVAVHIAKNSLQTIEIELAVCASANICLTTEIFNAFMRSGLLSPTNSCKTFDANADGYMRSEGVACLILSMKNCCLELGRITGSGVSHDGHGTGLFAPNKDAQITVIGDVCGERCQVRQVECHGTGTALGDQTEMASVLESHGKHMNTPFPLSSIKSSIGHTEACSGMASMIRVLALQSETLPQLHLAIVRGQFSEKNKILIPHVENYGFSHVTGINSFGPSGTNVHLILERIFKSCDDSCSAPYYILPLTAKSKISLQKACTQMINIIKMGGMQVGPMCCLAQNLCEAFKFRIVAHSLDVQQLHKELEKCITAVSSVEEHSDDKITMLFCGAGFMHFNMGLEFLRTNYVYQKSVSQCAEHFVDGWEFIDVVYPNHKPQMSQKLLCKHMAGFMGLFSLQNALTQVWLSQFGVGPDIVLGHSFGEYAAMVAASFISLAEGCHLVQAVWSMLEVVCMAETGSMVVGLCSAVVLSRILTNISDVDISCFNSTSQTAISGKRDNVCKVSALLVWLGIPVYNIINLAFHSPMLNVAKELSFFVDKVSFDRATNAKYISGISGSEMMCMNSDYIKTHLMRPVNFLNALHTVQELSSRTLLEIGPDCGLLNMIRNDVSNAILLASLSAKRSSWAQLSQSTEQLFCNCHSIAWNIQTNKSNAIMPSYEFEQCSFWINSDFSDVNPRQKLSDVSHDQIKRVNDAVSLTSVWLSYVPSLNETYRSDTKWLMHERSKQRHLCRKWQNYFVDFMPHFVKCDQVMQSLLTRTVTILMFYSDSHTMNTVILLLKHICFHGISAHFIVLELLSGTLICHEMLNCCFMVCHGLLKTFELESPISATTELFVQSSCFNQRVFGFLFHTTIPLHEAILLQSQSVSVLRILHAKNCNSCNNSFKGNHSRDCDALITEGYSGIGFQIFKIIHSVCEGTVFLFGQRCPLQEYAMQINMIRNSNKAVVLNNTNIQHHSLFSNTLNHKEHSCQTEFYHSAAVLHDMIFILQSRTSFRNVFTVQCDGALLIYATTIRNSEAKLIIFSSIIGLLGNHGQSNYAAANSATETIAQLTMKQGHMTLCTAWGNWSNAAYLSDRLLKFGLDSLDPQLGTSCLKQQVSGKMNFFHAIFCKARWDLCAKMNAAADKLLSFINGNQIINTKETIKKDDKNITEQKVATESCVPGAVMSFSDHTNLIKSQMQIILGIETDRISKSTPFTALGFDSLTLMELVNGITTRLPVCFRLTPGDMHEYYTIDKLSSYLLEQEISASELKNENKNKIRLTEIKAVHKLNALPLSLNQQHLLFMSEMESEAKYTLNEVARLIFSTSDKWNENIFQYALSHQVQTHTTLRTTFKENLQVIKSCTEAHQSITVGEWPNSRIIMFINQYYCFDLERTVPVRTQATINDHNSYVTLCFHHIITDGRTFHLLVKDIHRKVAELSTSPKIKPQNVVALHYVDYAVWQNQWIQSHYAQQQLDYWDKMLEKHEVLEIPSDKDRPMESNHRGKSLHVDLNLTQGEILRRLSKTINSSLFIVVLVAYSLLLSDYCRQKDILFGVYVTMRQHKELESMFGYFVNCVPFRNKLADHTLVDHLELVRSNLLSFYKNLEVPFGNIIERLGVERTAHGQPLTQARLNVYSDYNQNLYDVLQYRQSVRHLLNVDSLVPFTATAIFLENRSGLTIDYDMELFYLSTMKAIAKSFKKCIETITRLSESVESTLCQVSITRHFNENVTLANKSQDQMHMTFSYVTRLQNWLFSNSAFISCNRSVAPRKLSGPMALMQSRTIQQWCNKIRNSALAADSVVAVCMEKSIECVTSFFSIIATGMSFTAVDPTFPISRIISIITDSDATLIVADSFDNFNDDHTPTLNSTINAMRCMGISYCKSSTVDSLYAVYTSGSTGKPKGIAINNQTLMNLLSSSPLDGIDKYGLTSESVILQTHKFIFDGGLSDIFSALISQASLHICSDILQPHKEIISSKSTCSEIPIPLVNELSENHLKDFVCFEHFFHGAAVLEKRALNYLHRNSVYTFNSYGPTECTVDSTKIRGSLGNSPQLIGVPFPNYVVQLGTHGCNQPVPAAFPSQLLIGGSCLAKGYNNNHELTANKFPTIFMKNEENMVKHGSRLYLTGDLVKQTISGSLYFIGRNDFQVKIRGQRIELEEIERVITSHSLAMHAVAVTITDNTKNKRIAAYYVSEVLMPDTLRSYLVKHLPVYMIPAYLMRMDSLPLNASLKVDRGALPTPHYGHKTVVNGGSCESETEKLIIETWTKVLGHSNFNSKSVFFQVGGDSITALSVLNRLKEKYPLLTIRAIIEYQTIEQLLEQLSFYEIENTEQVLKFNTITSRYSGRIQKQYESIYKSGADATNLIKLHELFQMKHVPLTLQDIFRLESFDLMGKAVAGVISQGDIPARNSTLIPVQTTGYPESFLFYETFYDFLLLNSKSLLDGLSNALNVYSCHSRPWLQTELSTDSKAQRIIEFFKLIALKVFAEPQEMILAGHSAGGYLAHLMATELEQTTFATNCILLIDAGSAAIYNRIEYWLAFEIVYLRQSMDQQENSLFVLQHTMHMYKLFLHSKLQLVKHKVFLFTEDDNDTLQRTHEEWESRSYKPLASDNVCGDHFSMLSSSFQAKLCTKLNAIIAEHKTMHQ